MPEWLTTLLQGPLREGSALVILVVFGWTMFKHLANQHAQHLKDQNEQHKAHLASQDAKQMAELNRLESIYKETMIGKENEIKRLVEEKETIQKDRDALYRQIKAEQKKS